MTIADRINSISSCKEVFDNAKPYYEDASKSSSYMDLCMTYYTKADEATNVGRTGPEYPQFVGETLPSGQSATQDRELEQRKGLIQLHAKRGVHHKVAEHAVTLSAPGNPPAGCATQDHRSRQCNCSSRNSCPLNGKCLSKSVVYM